MRRPFTTIAALLLLAACADAPAPQAETPAYGARTLAGDSVSLASLAGSPVLLNIWATWCAPCREEMPSLQRLHRDYAARGLRILGVSIDSPSSRAAIAAFVREYGIEFTILHDPDERVTSVFRTIGVPETYLFDRNGKVVKRWIGQVDGDAAEVRQLVEGTLR